MSAECGKGWSNRCAESKGKVCRCKCGGVNHGTALGKAIAGPPAPPRSNYRVVTDCPEYVLLEDLGPWDKYLSITNDAEAVCATFAPELNGRPLLYTDSEGELTELRLKDGKFDTFRVAHRLPSGFEVNEAS